MRSEHQSHAEIVLCHNTDLWLVKTVGLILGTIGAVLSLALVDVVHITTRVISPIYLADAFVELILVFWWIVDL